MMLATLALDWSQRGPVLMVLFSAPLKCLCSSHVHPCLLLEALRVFIGKLGDVAETRSEPVELARWPISLW